MRQHRHHDGVDHRRHQRNVFRIVFPGEETRLQIRDAADQDIDDEEQQGTDRQRSGQQGQCP